MFNIYGVPVIGYNPSKRVAWGCSGSLVGVHRDFPGSFDPGELFETAAEAAVACKAAVLATIDRYLTRLDQSGWCWSNDTVARVIARDRARLARRLVEADVPIEDPRIRRVLLFTGPIR